jgi:hypothetical protein
MKILSAAALVVSAGMSLGAVAQAIDGTKALNCVPQEAVDCLPGQACKKAKAENTDVAKNVTIDFAGKTMVTPYRTTPLSIANVVTTDEQLMAQGTDRSAAWTAVVFKSDGRITFTVADKKGAYILFGKCTVK